jgi:hypothetical protein
MGSIAMKRIYYIATLFLIFIGCGSLAAQETVPIRDTIKQSVIVDSRIMRQQQGLTTIQIEAIKGIISPAGEGDAIKFIQTLPGVSTGAEGTSSYYVRGGNSGNNAVTLDGVPIYGISHLMGMTSTIPAEIVTSADYRAGGFDAEFNNFTSSVVNLKSKGGGFVKPDYSAFINNIFAGASANIPLSKEKASLLLSGRYSPFQLEYKALKSFLPKEKLPFDKLQTNIFDLYGKFSYRIDDASRFEFFLFGTEDSYGFGKEDLSKNYLRWGNIVSKATYSRIMKSGRLYDASLAYNRFSSGQRQEVYLEGTLNELAIKSGLNEITLNLKTEKERRGHSFITGLKLMYSLNAPGSSKLYEGEGRNVEKEAYVRNPHHSILNTLYFQYSTTAIRNFFFKLSLKASLYTPDLQSELHTEGGVLFRPEGSLLASYIFSKYLQLEASVDRTVQFYHVLEGLPIGWSMDLMVPACKKNKPEESTQFYFGLSSRPGNHYLSLGGYYKFMNNLVFYTDATTLFSASLSGWSDNIEMGKGTSYGGEFMYRYTTPKTHIRVAYTLSKTDRTFENINYGESFPAKFDRRHILNLAASYGGFNTSFTLQSGHWESVKTSIYPGVLPDGSPIILDYFGRPNNYRMPTYIRWDIGYSFKWERPKVKHYLNVGIFNVLNRHNAFTLWYDSENNNWKQLSLFPIMPSISYRVTF